MKSLQIASMIILVFALLVVPLAFLSAQTVGTPYGCPSGQTGYWSSYPCGGSNYNYSYVYSYPYQSYPYQQSYMYGYPNYPYNYQNYYNYSYAYPTPSCTITVSSSYVGGHYGYGYVYNQPATLSWSASNATSAYIYPDVGTVATYGSRTVYPAANATYTMMVYGPGGTNTCQTTYYQQYPNYQYQYQYQNYYNYPNYNYPYQYQYGYPNYWW
ncbi:hypothetical protein HY417_00500 [Candidatus Kaiserbacteria bacterium]|nr:hypothetical protein [Candidatus Kaiserbacteria bacterium]